MAKDEAEMTVEEAIAEIKRKPTVRLWPTIAKLRGISKGAVYAAAERGEIDVLNAREPADYEAEELLAERPWLTDPKYGGMSEEVAKLSWEAGQKKKQNGHAANKQGAVNAEDWRSTVTTAIVECYGRTLRLYPSTICETAMISILTSYDVTTLRKLRGFEI